MGISLQKYADVWPDPPSSAHGRMLPSQGWNDPDHGAVPVPASHSGPVCGPAAGGALPLTPGVLHQPRCQSPLGLGRWVWESGPRDLRDGHGEWAPLRRRVHSPEAASARTGTRLQVFTTGHSLASSSSPERRLGGTSPVSLTFELGAGIYNRAEKGTQESWSCLKCSVSFISLSRTRTLGALLP